MDKNYSIGGFHHTCYFTDRDNIDKVKDFYVDFMGFEVESDVYVEKYDTRMLFVVKGEMRIEVVNGKATDVPGTIDHLCFYCKNLPAVVEDLTKMGYKVEEPMDVIREGKKLATMQFFIGPVGERIELYEVY